MNKILILYTASVFLIVFASPVLANDQRLTQNGPGPNFEQHRSELLSLIDERISKLQEDKTCIQAANNNNDLKVCKDRHLQEETSMREKRLSESKQK